MGLFKNSLSAIGRLITVVALAGTFMVGLIGVVYLQLRGEEITIPKVTGKNFNDGKDELTLNGLRIKKIATRYSNEDPNTILEQRPKAGTTAKTGLMISVIVSEPNPDGSEAPVDVKDDEEAIDEIESLPELKTEKSKKKAKSSKTKKVESKTRDVVKKKESKKEDAVDKEKPASKPGDILAGGKSDSSGTEKKETPKKETKKQVKPKTDKPQPPKKETKPKSNGDTRSRKVQPSN